MSERGNDRPLLSVVIPVHNERPYLADTLQSLKAAVDEADIAESVELIVVDDGSTDDSGEVVRRDMPVPVELITQENRGRLAARERGIVAARGEFVLTLDARVSLDSGALAFWLGQRRSHPERVMWNGATRPVIEGPYSAFWEMITRLGWSAYHADPRLVSYGLEEFDRFPKGTGMFIAPRQTWLSAYKGMNAESGPVAARYRSDDTALIRHMVGSVGRIWLGPGFSGSHLSGRERLVGFIRHARERGVRFVDSYLSSSSQVGQLVRIAPALFPLALVAMVAAFLADPLLAAVGVLLALLAGVAWVARTAGEGEVGRLRIGLVFLPFVLSFGAGMLQGYWMHAWARLRTLRPGGLLMVSAAGLAASGLSFIVFVLAGRELSATGFADFAAVWGLLFGGASILSAFEMESARRSASRRGAMRPLVVISLTTTVVLALSVWLLLPVAATVFSIEDRTVLVPLILGLALYPQFYLVRGWLAGQKRLKSYSAASLLEGLLRPATLLVVGVATTWRFTLAAAAGAAAWLPWTATLVRLGARADGDAATDPLQSPWAGTTRALGNLMSGQVAAAMLVTGMPATLTAVLGRSNDEQLALAIVLITVSRLPLLLLSSFYGLLVPWFVERKSSSWGRDRLVITGLGAATLIVLGGLVVLAVIALFFPATLTPGYGQAVLYIFGALLLGGITVMTARLVADDRHSAVQSTWWLTVIITLASLLLVRLTPVPLVEGVGVAVALGPAAGLTWALWRSTVGVE